MTIFPYRPEDRIEDFVDNKDICESKCCCCSQTFRGSKTRLICNTCSTNSKPRKT